MLVPTIVASTIDYQPEPGAIGLPPLQEAIAKVFQASLSYKLTPEMGVGTYNFSSDLEGDQTHIPYDDGVVDCKAHEARFNGMRRVRNYHESGLHSLAFAAPFNCRVEKYIENDEEVVRFYISGSPAICASSFSTGLTVTEIAASTIHIRISDGFSTTSGNIGIYCGYSSASYNVPLAQLSSTEWTRTSGPNGNSLASASRGILVTDYNGPTDESQWIELRRSQIENVHNRGNTNPSEDILCRGNGNPELVADYDFNDAAQWTTDGESSVTGGQLVIPAGALGNNQPNPALYAEVGKLYAVYIDVAVDGADFSASAVFGGDTIWTSGSGTGRIYKEVRATSASFLSIQTTFTAAETRINSISVKEIEHGSNVDGVKWFPYTNPNEVVSNVVLPTATVTPLTGSGTPIEPSRINKCYDYENLDRLTQTALTAVETTSNKILGRKTWELQANATGTAVRLLNSNARAYTKITNSDQTVSLRIDPSASTAPFVAIMVQDSTAGDTIYKWFNLSTLQPATFYVAGGTTMLEIASSVEVEHDGSIRCSISVSTGAGTTINTLIFPCDQDNVVPAVSSASSIGEVLLTCTALQIEAGDYVTTDIPNDGVTGGVTRTYDTLKIDGDNMGTVANDFTVLYTIKTPKDFVNRSSLSYIFHRSNSISDGFLSVITTSGYIRGTKLYGAPYFAESDNPVVADTEYRVAVRYSSVDGIAMAINGAMQTTTDSNTNSIDFSVGDTDIHIGGSTLNTNHLGMVVKDYKIFQKALPDVKMQELTA